jgi:hypothetical protein
MLKLQTFNCKIKLIPYLAFDKRTTGIIWHESTGQGFIERLMA